MVISMYNLLPMLIQLTEKDKRLLIALFILLIVLFVLVAYIAHGIKALMNRYSKGIDGYMHDLCEYGLVKNPKEFKKQVYKRETKVLYLKTRWAFRLIVVVSAVLLIYGSSVSKDSGEKILSFFANAMNDLRIHMEWPKGEFFGINNFPIDWPIVTKWPSPQLSFGSIISYLSIIAYAYSLYMIVTGALRYIARLRRGHIKSEEVFNKSLDDFNVDGEIK